MRGSPGDALHLKTGPDGRLSLVFMETTGNVTEWSAMTSGGVRDIVFDIGNVAHDGSADKAVQALGIAMATIAKGGIPENAAPGKGSFADRALRQSAILSVRAGIARDGAGDLPQRFFSVAGQATFEAHRLGMPADAIRALRGIDAACGWAETDRFFAQWPFLIRMLTMYLSGAPRASLISMVGAQDAVEEVARVLALHGDRPVRGLAPAQDEDGFDEIDFDMQQDDGADREDGEDDEEAGPEADAAAAVPDEDAAVDPRLLDALRILLRRMRGVETGDWAAPSLFALLSAVPATWIPSSTEEFDGFARTALLLSTLVKASSGNLDIETLAASSKGRWAEFAGRLGGVREASDIKDVFSAYVRQAAMPALLHSSTFGEGPGVRSAKLREMVSGVAGNWPAGDGQALNAHFWRSLFGRKSAPALFEASALWHRRNMVLDERFANGPDVAWAAPFDSIEIAPGTALVSIRDSVSLRREGAALRHCVGGYVENCLTGQSVIAAIRRTNPDGETVSTSTVEFRGWTRGQRFVPDILQHRGMLNAAPSGDDVADLEAACAVLRGTETPNEVGADGASPAAAPFWMLPSRWWHALVEEAEGDIEDRRAGHRYFRNDRLDAHSRAAGYDWTDREAVEDALRLWRPFVSRDEADAGVGGFFAYHARSDRHGWSGRLADRVATAVEQAKPPSKLRVGLGVAAILALRLGRSRAMQAIVERPGLAALVLLLVGAGYVGSFLYRASPPAVTTVKDSAPAVVEMQEPVVARPVNAVVLSAYPIPRVFALSAEERKKAEAEQARMAGIEQAIVGRLWSVAVASGTFCTRRGDPIAADNSVTPRVVRPPVPERAAVPGRPEFYMPFPCASLADMLVAVDGDQVSVYRAAEGRPLLWTFGSKGTEKEGRHSVWPEGTAWSGWITDRLDNGKLKR